MTYIPTSEKCKIIKKALKLDYPSEKFRVYKGSGTASHWIQIRAPQSLSLDRASYNLIQERAVKALKEAGTEPSTYCSDDGYNSEYYCLNVDFNY